MPYGAGYFYAPNQFSYQSYTQPILPYQNQIHQTYYQQGYPSHPPYYQHPNPFYNIIPPYIPEFKTQPQKYFEISKPQPNSDFQTLPENQPIEKTDIHKALSDVPFPLNSFFFYPIFSLIRFQFQQETLQTAILLHTRKKIRKTIKKMMLIILKSKLNMFLILRILKDFIISVSSKAQLIQGIFDKYINDPQASLTEDFKMSLKKFLNGNQEV
jgi:hypothetical protein